ncbi:MAG TPA: DUF3050 domain-containing protein [Edaphobacter sp.]|nr:DUF3050 domain-containing protein [Edaphobacter sp.]
MKPLNLIICFGLCPTSLIGLRITASFCLATFSLGTSLQQTPNMFRSLVRQLNQETSGKFDQLVWYLERHIEVDGDDHGPLSLKMVADLCGDDPALWEEASQAVEEALRARLRLWNGVLPQIEEG